MLPPTSVVRLAGGAIGQVMTAISGPRFPAGKFGRHVASASHMAECPHGRVIPGTSTFRTVMSQEHAALIVNVVHSATCNKVVLRLANIAMV